MRTKRDGLDLSEFASEVELLSIESKVDAASVSGLDDDFPPATDRACTAGGQNFGRGRGAVGGDRDPGFFTGLNDDREFALSCGGNGSR